MFIGFFSPAIAVTFIKHLEVRPPFSAPLQSGGGQTCTRRIRDWIRPVFKLKPALAYVRHIRPWTVSLICRTQILMTALYKNLIFFSLFFIPSAPAFRVVGNFNIKKHIYNSHTSSDLFRTWKFHLVTNYSVYLQPVRIITYLLTLNLGVSAENQPSRFHRGLETGLIPLIIFTIFSSDTLSLCSEWLELILA